MAGLFESRATPAASGSGFAMPGDMPWPGTDTGGGMTLVSPTRMRGEPTLVPSRATSVPLPAQRPLDAIERANILRGASDPEIRAQEDEMIESYDNPDRRVDIYGREVVVKKAKRIK